ncbi:hypothetical protein VTN77DRAFT_7635 [Rasamsonia byssochlamydoides]|uniref:uncharacterized protein n=1 Tax=Rasamsonia byssochlamydoides TaxID=89139 RepID=UPI003743BE3D
MATLTMTPTVRRPFASLDTTRLRSLQRAKENFMNQQNGAATISLKRSVPSDSDSENVDPTTLKQSPKRKRSFEGDDELSKEPLKTPKTNRIALVSSESKVAHDASTSRANRASTPLTTKICKPAGRSPPPSKPCNAFGRRSTSIATRTELVSKRAVHRAPFSIATALATEKPKRHSPVKPASWFFDIYVDTEQDEMTNSMQHSACFLDISDDEGKAKADGRGKENIPPHELGIVMPTAAQQTTTDATSRKNLMTDEPRTPLGELKVSDYYGTGCHALSFVIVEDDEPEALNEKTVSVDVSSSQPESELVSASTISSLEVTTPVEDSQTAPEQSKAVAPSEAE